MRRKLLFAGGVGAVVLATAGVAAAANGGFTPQFPHSPNAHRINHAYYLILGLTAAIFVLVEALLLLFTWKYRSRGRARTVEGLQVHGHTRLEMLWTGGPILILGVIAAFVFYKLPGIADAPASTNPVEITVEGHQFYWQFDYPNGTRSINDLHVPVGQVVDLKVVSGDVVHSWWIPQLGGKLQAIPGQTNHTWFEADRAGTYYGQCAELCGLYHEAMKARVIASAPHQFTSYVRTKAAPDLGRAEFQGVCATCHGMHGQGGYGPAISTNPILIQRSGLENILRNGFNGSAPGMMPPVGDTWTTTQIDALLAYVKSKVFKGAPSSGG